MVTSSCFHGQQTGSSQTTECSHHVAEAPLTLYWQQTVAVSPVSSTHTHTYTYPPHTYPPHMYPHPLLTAHTLLTSHASSSRILVLFSQLIPHTPSSSSHSSSLTHPHPLLTAHTLLTSHAPSSHTLILFSQLIPHTPSSSSHSSHPPHLTRTLLTHPHPLLTAHTLLTSHVPSSHTLILFSQLIPSSPHTHPPHAPSSSSHSSYPPHLSCTLLTSHIPSSPHTHPHPLLTAHTLLTHPHSHIPPSCILLVCSNYQFNCDTGRLSMLS